MKKEKNRKQHRIYHYFCKVNKQVTKHFLRNTGILDKIKKKREGNNKRNIWDSGYFQGVTWSGIVEKYK